MLELDAPARGARRLPSRGLARPPGYSPIDAAGVGFARAKKNIAPKAFLDFCLTHVGRI